MVMILKLTINQSPVMNGTHSRGDGQGQCGHHFNSCRRWGGGGGARSGRQMEDSINHPLRNINGKCEGGETTSRGAWPSTVIHAVGNYGVHGSV
jgi:hypothetical protein